MRIRTVLLLAFLLFLAAAFWHSHQSHSPFEHSRSAFQGRESSRFGEYPRREYGHEPRRYKQDEAPDDTMGAACSSQYFAPWQEPEDAACTAVVRNGQPTPDPRCTPGGVNPKVTTEVLRNRAWRTRSVRNCQSSEEEKHAAYGWYGIRKPRYNSGDDQVCELDHLVPLELGGADGLGNIWPECGPNTTTLDDRYFKIKDRVENYLADEVKAGRISLDTAQRGIAQDWTQYLDAANKYCREGGRC